MDQGLLVALWYRVVLVQYVFLHTWYTQHLPSDGPTVADPHHMLFDAGTIIKYVRNV